jgi:uncharacterized membrane protein HdeD (DUF308 family)
MVIGLILIAVGIIAILVKTDVLTGSIWDYVWPTALIIIGLSFFLGRFRRRRWWWFNWRPHWDDWDKPKKE